MLHMHQSNNAQIKMQDLTLASTSAAMGHSTMMNVVGPHFFDQSAKYFVVGYMTVSKVVVLIVNLFQN